MSDKLKRALKRTNFDELNEKGYVRVTSKAKQPLEIDNEPILVKGKPEKLIKDYELVKGAPFQPEPTYTKVSKMGEALKGRGKLGALAAAATLGYQAFKGEPVQAQEVLKAGAEALNPLPFSLDEIKEETSKLDPMREVKIMEAEKLRRKQLQEERARPEALEFGGRLREAMRRGRF